MNEVMEHDARLPDLATCLRQAEVYQADVDYLPVLRALLRHLERRARLTESAP